MKLLKRLALTTLVTGALVAAAAPVPASAVVNGRDATSPYPGMAVVSIVYPGLGTAICGGFLVAPRWLLTGAHCVSDDAQAPTPVAMPAGNVTLRTGTVDRTQGGRTDTGKQVVLYPDWVWGMPTGLPVSDLALVELTKPVPGQVMRLDELPADEAGWARIIGWGLTSWPPTTDTTPPTILQQRDVRILPTNACDGGGIGTAETCVSGGACFGDSGSPLLHPQTTHPARTLRWAALGLVSRETDENAPCSKPTIYTNLQYRPFRDWITQTIQTNRPTRWIHPQFGAVTPADRQRLRMLTPPRHH
ncbi:trypsin-like serine protease [Actinoplanes sp. NPDC026619]|uniref:S1 family peptidase n=1 Tax=Actinoplanes sp. NPDC026619 TaxID=3155798 RepID=UPI003405689F